MEAKNNEVIKGVTLAKILNLSERHLRRLAEENVIKKNGQNKYLFLESIHSYLDYLELKNDADVDLKEEKIKEEIKKIKVIEFKKNFSTGIWKCEIEINGKYNITLKEDELGGEIRTSLYNANEIRINKEKVNKINSVEIEYL